MRGNILILISLFSPVTILANIALEDSKQIALYATQTTLDIFNKDNVFAWRVSMIIIFLNASHATQPASLALANYILIV